MWDKILSIFKTDVIKQIGDTVDGLSTSDDEKSQAKATLTQIVLGSLTNIIQAQASVIKTEMQGNWLQQSWRPITMLTFVALLVIRWTGMVNYEVDPTLESQLLDIIKLGLGGYVIGRSAEKIASTVTENIDMPFLKKKDRNS